MQLISPDTSSHKSYFLFIEINLEITVVILLLTEIFSGRLQARKLLYF